MTEKIKSSSNKNNKKFDHQHYIWKAGIDYRLHPNAYRVGKGEQGVLICEPYKSEILPYWKFSVPEKAAVSSKKIYRLFLNYLKNNDFIGADMARKFLQMGFTRARRYANYKGGQKYSSETGAMLERGTGDPRKVISAQIFYDQWQKAEKNKQYAQRKLKWKTEIG